MMEAVDEVNEAQKNVLFQKIETHFSGSLRDRTIAIWGLAFKPRTDDIREAPAMVLINSLLEAGADLRVHDPEALANVRAIYGERLTYCDRPYGALEQADALVIATEWNEFRNPDFEIMIRLLRSLSFSMAATFSIRADDRAGVYLSWHGPGRGRFRLGSEAAMTQAHGSVSELGAAGAGLLWVCSQNQVALRPASFAR